MTQIHWGGGLGWALGVALAAFLATASLTHPLVGWLRARQMGKAFRVDGPDHAAKAGTPTMGGLVMWAVLMATAALLAWRAPEPAALWTVLAATLGFGILGWIDDWAGLARKGRAREIGVGLSARRMILLQLVWGLACAWILRGATPTRSSATLSLGLPTAPADIAAQWGTLPWLIFGALVIVATVNGVNLSDGLDGLAAGLCALALIGLSVVLAIPGGWNTEATWSLAAAGAALGFLVHNRHPARAFMGNGASMALGGSMAALALGTGAWSLLPIIGAVFVIEILSVVIQVGTYKMTDGHRVFRMAPIHHHFELGGWPEPRIVRRFWLSGLVAAAAGVGLSLLG